MVSASLVAAVTSASTAAVVALVAWRLVLLEKKTRELERLVSEEQRRLADVAGELQRLGKRVGVLENMLSKALESYMAEEMLELLRRRRRRRYIVFYVVTEDGASPSPEEVENAILSALERLAGQLAVAASRVQLVYYIPEKAAGIVRASHETKYLVLAAMGFVRKIGGRRALLVPVRTTGTIKTAKRVLGLAMRELKK